jgi:toxin ParE1/3/4
MPKYTLDPCIEVELWSIWDFIVRDNPDAAARVLEAAYETFKAIAANPGVGQRRRFRNPKLRNIRSWRISGFENYLIFYRETGDGVQIHHVYHGARNIDALFHEV